MRKKSKYDYFDDEEYEAEDSPYDFSAVDLRGENHRKDLDDDFENFSFDDDSYGDLPFEDDLELVEEDFAIRNVTESDDDMVLSDGGEKDIDDEQFVLEHPDDAPDFTEDFLEDDGDDFDRAFDVAVGVTSDDDDKAAPKVDVSVQPQPQTAQSEVAALENVAPSPKRVVPKMRNSALQPLIVINRSKHSFDPAKKNMKSAEGDGFDDFDESDFSGFDDDIEDISAMLGSENFSSEATGDDTAEIAVESGASADAAVSDSDGEVSEELAPEELTYGEDTAFPLEEDAENISLEVIPVIEDSTEEPCDSSFEESSGETAENSFDEPAVASFEEFAQDSGDGPEDGFVVSSDDTSADGMFTGHISEEIPDVTEVPADGKIFFDDTEDEIDSADETDADIEAMPVFGAEKISEDEILKRSRTDVSDTVDLPAEHIENKTVSEESSVDKRIIERKLARKKKKRKKQVKKLVKEILSWAGLVAAAFMIAIVINLYVARPSVVSGRSMMPTLHDGDTIVISKLPYMLGDVEYGDIVVIDRQVNRDRTFAVEVVESLKYNVLTQSLFDENELTEDTFWVKRIIGKPGDIIEFHEGKVYRNGELLTENYIYTQDVTNYPNGEQFVVQEGCVFVMGDNRNESLDSRILAMHEEQIAIDHIVGKLISK